jgi:hypothetical protein
MALLKLSDQYSAERLEAACAKGLFYTPRPSYKSIQTILKSGQDKVVTQPESESHSEASSQAEASKFGFTRGADYYGAARAANNAISNTYNDTVHDTICDAACDTDSSFDGYAVSSTINVSNVDSAAKAGRGQS